MRRDPALAATLFERACEGGVGDGCSSLGVMYQGGSGQRGTGVKRDSARAVSLFQRGCERGGMDACTRLGVLYRQGTGVPRDAARAAALLKQACDGNNLAGCSHLGALYAAGDGVSQDFTRAAELFRKSCDAKVALGCVGLGRLHAAGNGVPETTPRRRISSRNRAMATNRPAAFSSPTPSRPGPASLRIPARRVDVPLGVRRQARRSLLPPRRTVRQGSGRLSRSPEGRDVQASSLRIWIRRSVSEGVLMAETSGEALIAAANLTKHYKDVVALNDVSFSIFDGITGILGENGVGKSTAIKICPGPLARRRARPGVGRGRVIERRLRGAARLHAQHDCLPSQVSAAEFLTHMAEGAASRRPPPARARADTLRHTGLFGNDTGRSADTRRE